MESSSSRAPRDRTLNLDLANLPDDLFDPRPVVRSVGGLRKVSTPKAETIRRVKEAIILVDGGVPVSDVLAQVGISHTAYKDTKNWMKKNQI